MIFLDTETCGFHGMAILLQYAENDGDINLYNFWTNPVGESLEKIEYIAEREVCGFNLAFDWFHLCKIYTVFSMLDKDDYPMDIIDHIGAIESRGRTGQCLKPRSACDLMLLARKGPYQSLMNRKDIRIRRVPSILAVPLAEELNKRIQLDDIYFAKRKVKASQWGIFDCTKDGVYDLDFKDIVLRFRAGGTLKILAQYVLGETDTIKLKDIMPSDKFRPNELGWAPFATAIGKPGNWKMAWPEVIKPHINFWEHNPLGRKYAWKDVDYTRRLWAHESFGCPEAGDDDSVLACMVGAVRWRGFKIDIEQINKLRDSAIKLAKTAPKAPGRAKAFILPHMDETEQLAMRDYQGNITTKKPILESIARWMNDDETDKHPAAIAAKQVLVARKAAKEVELYDKLLVAGRFHASFVVIGTLSTRMAGSDGLNPQGINHKKEVRSAFPLADDGFNLCGGDFDAFEVVLAEAVYNDPDLRKALQELAPCDWCDPKNPDPNCEKCDGEGQWKKKIHALFGMQLFPPNTYDQILRSKGTDDDMYLKGKSGVFAMIFGGDENTLVNKLAVALEQAQQAFKGFGDEFPGVNRARKRVHDKFCSMRQPKGIGTNVEWHEPADFVESLFGFKRYFTLENKICKALFNLANDPPAGWKSIKFKVQRRQGRIQTAAGALMSALYGAAFQIQAANMRAAANHEIQSSGATITKRVQRAVWGVQPHGVHEWIVVPMNVHDEVITPTKPGFEDKVQEIVYATVETFRDKVPLILMKWKQGLKSWAGK